MINDYTLSLYSNIYSPDIINALVLLEQIELEVHDSKPLSLTDKVTNIA